MQNKLVIMLSISSYKYARYVKYSVHSNNQNGPD